MHKRFILYDMCVWISLCRAQEQASCFFFQAEDGIRDLIVTGVQTCALPIDRKSTRLNSSHDQISYAVFFLTGVQTCALPIDRKSTRLNSSHDQISYAVFCLKKKNTTNKI